MTHRNAESLRGDHPPCRVVVAVGGNAISDASGDHSVIKDYANLRQSLENIVDLVERGYEVILTHGNGPQVGNQMIRVELARGQAPDLPLDLVVADLQGGLGYMIERVLFFFEHDRPAVPFVVIGDGYVVGHAGGGLARW